MQYDQSNETMIGRYRRGFWHYFGRVVRTVAYIAGATFVARWALVQLQPIRLKPTKHTTTPIGPSAVTPGLRRIVVSDLHLGNGDRLDDFDADAVLVDFITHYVRDSRPTELILAGDAFEFLQVRLPNIDDDDWSEESAIQRLDAILKAHALVTQALGAYIAEPANQLTVLIGNHDFELHYQGVKRRLREALGLREDDERLRFGISYHGGGIYLVHGNQFDSWNRFVRFEGVSEPFEVVRGTQLVKEIINDLEQDPLEIAPLVDNVKPSSALFWYLITLPRLRHRASRRFMLRGVMRVLQTIAWSTPDHMPIDGHGTVHLRGIALSTPLRKWITAFRRQRVSRHREVAQTVSEMAEYLAPHDEVVDQVQIEAHRQLRREMDAFGDAVTYEMFRLARSSEYGANSLFVCGHTHQAAVVSLGPDQSYINTGTWTEVVYDIATMHVQEQRYPFLEITYPHDPIRPKARLLVWQRDQKQPQPWQSESGLVREQQRISSDAPVGVRG